MNTVVLNDKKFKSFIEFQSIQNRIKQLANEINQDYDKKNPLFIAILDGSFMFAAELYKNITIQSEISFVKFKSYVGDESHDLKKHIGLNQELKGRHVIVVEDIVDTGKTLNEFLPQVKEMGALSLKVATLLSKPSKHNFRIDYVGFEISNEFVVGFGLDYEGLGRNINFIAQMCG